MASLVIMYKTPTDMTAFDQYYFETHAPLVKNIPGLQKYTVSTGPVGTPSGPSAFYLIATLEFESLQDVQAAFGSPEGAAAAGDLTNFATGGTDMVMFDTKEL